MDDFSLKYLGKFIFAQDIYQISIRGGLLPVKTIKMDNITLLNLSEQGLFSEDLFILSKFLKRNK